MFICSMKMCNLFSRCQIKGFQDSCHFFSTELYSYVEVSFFFVFVLFCFLRSPAISLGFTTLGEIFAYVTVF